MFVLSNIVRYYPGMWFAITRLGEDDRCLAYAHEFTDYCEEAFPTAIVEVLEGA